MHSLQASRGRTGREGIKGEIKLIFGGIFSFQLWPQATEKQMRFLHHVQGMDQNIRVEKGEGGTPYLSAHAVYIHSSLIQRRTFLPLHKVWSSLCDVYNRGTWWRWLSLSLSLHKFFSGNLAMRKIQQWLAPPFEERRGGKSGLTSWTLKRDLLGWRRRRGRIVS